MNKRKINFLTIARAAAKIADAKKGEDIYILSAKNISNLADYFLLVTADSLPQINAISETITKTFKENYNLLPLHREGKHSASWTVLDYGGLIIHILSFKTRHFYRLENIWEKARRISF